MKNTQNSQQDLFLVGTPTGKIVNHTNEMPVVAFGDFAQMPSANSSSKSVSPKSTKDSASAHLWWIAQ